MVRLKFINNIKQRGKKYNAYIFYTIIFAVVALAVFWLFIKTGKSFIWKTDGFKQHYAELYSYIR